MAAMFDLRYTVGHYYYYYYYYYYYSLRVA